MDGEELRDSDALFPASAVAAESADSPFPAFAADAFAPSAAFAPDQHSAVLADVPVAAAAPISGVPDLGAYTGSLVAAGFAGPVERFPCREELGGHVFAHPPHVLERAGGEHYFPAEQHCCLRARCFRDAGHYFQAGRPHSRWDGPRRGLRVDGTAHLLP